MKRGFTLIELLVVIAIIGILSSIVLVNTTDSRIKTRNIQRKQAIVQLRNALEQYHVHNGSYPVMNRPITGWAGTFCAYGTATTDWIPGLTTSDKGGPFIAALPRDPKPPTGGSCWGYLYYSPTGRDYKLLAWNSVEGAPIAATDPFHRRPSPCLADPYQTKTYAVYTEGAKCW